MGLLISVAFLAIFLARTDYSEIKDAFSGADLLLACAVTPLYFVGFWLRTVRWRFLLRPVSDVPILRLFPVVLIGLMANNLAPARIGELVRAYLVGERESMSKSTALGTIAVDRVFDGLTLVAILGISIALSDVNAGVTGIGIGTTVIFLAAALVLVALAFSPVQARSWLLRLIGLAPARISERLVDMLDSFLVGLGAIRSPAALIGACFFSIASWMVEGGMYYLIGSAFNLDVDFTVYLIILSGANLALSIVATPGGVGPFETTTQAILVHFSVEKGLASAYALALHALLLGPVIIVGLVLLWTTRFSLRDIMGVRPPNPPAPPITPVVSGGVE